MRVKQTLLVLGHILISAEQVAGGIFQTGNPEAQDKEDRAASLTLLLNGGNQLTVTEDAALFLWEYLVQHHGQRIGALDHVMISKCAVQQLQEYFTTAHPTKAIAHTCKAIVAQLAQCVA